MITAIEAALGGAPMPKMGGAPSPSTPCLTAPLAAVDLPPIAPATDEEELLAKAAAGLPEAVLHASPSERAGNLPLRLGV